VELAYALAGITARVAELNGDTIRYVMECIPAGEYHVLGSAGRWLRVAERCAVDGGLVAEGEIDDRAQRRASGQPPSDDAGGTYPEPVRTLPVTSSRPAHTRREPPAGAEPRFAPGDRVVVRDHRPDGHTRLPGYLRGRPGEVAFVNGFWVYPDTHAHGVAEAPTWVYAVRFAAGDLWPGAGPHEVVADLFEPYLEAADGR
jgi:nitrile hydratase